MSFLKRFDVICLIIALILPLIDRELPSDLRFGDLMSPIFLFAILGLGLNIVTGFTGLLNLGVAAFMAIGAYTYSIVTCNVFPYQVGFWGGLGVTLVVGTIAGILLGAPTLRLRGDYLAIVTLGFGEIIQDTFKNIDTITKGTQGINPLAKPTFLGYAFDGRNYEPWYYLVLGILVVVVIVCRNLENSRIGRTWVSIREDELAANCMGINVVKAKLLAFATGAVLCSLMGALYATSLNTSGEPSNYDFQVSIIALCICIVGGMGNINGVLLGALVIIGINDIVLVKLTKALAGGETFGDASVLASPSNWKYMIYGLALILMMRFRPEGIIPSRRVKAELHHEEGEAAS